MIRSYTSSPPSASMACRGTALPLLRCEHNVTKNHMNVSHDVNRLRNESTGSIFSNGGDFSDLHIGKVAFSQAQCHKHVWGMEV
jgi:hypothetical protein